MKIPQGCILKESLLSKILKSFYGLKQVGRFWNKTIAKFFHKISFISTNADSCILIIKRKKKLIIIGMYIDKLALRLKSIKALE